MRATLMAACLAVALLAAACGRSSDPVVLSGADEPTRPAPRQSPAAVPEPPSVDPEAPPQVAPGEPGASAPDLSALGLQVADLPVGTGLDRESAVGAVGATGGFRRNFSVDGTMLEATKPVELQSDILLFPDEETATAVLGQVRESLTSARAADAFRRALMNALGLEPDELLGSTATFPELGDGTVAALGSFDTPAGRADSVLIVTRVSLFQHVLVIVTPGGRVDLEDLTPLVATVVERLEAEEVRLREHGGLPPEPRELPPGPGAPAGGDERTI